MERDLSLSAAAAVGRLESHDLIDDGIADADGV